MRGIPIHYDERGEGRPVLILHGLTLEHRIMTNRCEPIFGARAGRIDRMAWRRIYPDMPGHGATPAPDWLASQDEMLEILVEFIVAVAGDERLVVIGHSWGAYLASGLANRIAERIDGLMLIIPMVRAERSRRDLPPHTIIVNDPSAVAAARPDEQMWVELSVVRTHDTLARYRERDAMTPPDDAFLERLEPRYAFSFEGELRARIDAPALVLTGRQDSIVGYRDAWSRLEHLPRATFAVLDRAGHALESEQPGLFAALTDEWLDRVEEWIGR